MTEFEYVKTRLHKNDRGERWLCWRGWQFVEEWPLPDHFRDCGELTTYAWSGDGRGCVRKNPFMGSGDYTDDQWLDKCLLAIRLLDDIDPPDYPLDGVAREIHMIEDLTAYLAALESFKASAV